MEEFEKARDKIMMGAERRSMVMSEKEKINTAYHEAGHAIIGRLVPEHDPVHKVTIIPRGRALGVTQYLPEEDRYSMSRNQLFSQLCSLFGGRIAEEIIGGFDAVTTGASNDIERATQMARNMVTKWGLNEKMGPILYGEDESQAPGGGNTHYSEDTSREIDQEVKTILNDAYARATKLLTDNRDILEAMKDALMEYETIDADQVDDLMNRRKVREPRHWDKNDFDSSGGGASKADQDADNESPIGGTVEDV
jgi:cell division protease FtsH